jgi:hypothetical protein
VLNNPLAYTDPSGFLEQSIGSQAAGFEVYIYRVSDASQQQSGSDAAKPTPEGAKERSQAEARKNVQENSCAGAADCNAQKSNDIAPRGPGKETVETSGIARASGGGTEITSENVNSEPWLPASVTITFKRESSQPSALSPGGMGNVLGGFAQLTSLAIPVPFLQGIRPFAAARGGANFVYRSVDAAGAVNYVGITNNLARRAAEQLSSKGIQIEKLMGGLSRLDARAVEQALIEVHGLARNGGTLRNQINSIATSNPAYASQLERGYELLRSIGY